MNPVNSHPTPVRRIAIGVAALALVLAACGSNDDGSTSNATEPAPAGDATAEAEPAADDDSDTSTSTDTDTDSDTEAAAPEEAADGATVTTAESALGTIIVDAGGRTLYGFTPDVDGLPTCTDDCADAWPPYAVEGGVLPAGLDAAIFSVVAHPSGVDQLAAGGWPLYYFAADIAPGDTNGQGSGDVWFVVAPDGSLIGAPDTGVGAEESLAAGGDGY